MAEATFKPVIFLAFANDRDDTVGYLRNLPDEARLLRDVLEVAERSGLCEVVVRSNSTAGDIFKVFQHPRYRNRIAIFHYGGHANGYQLLLESSAGQAAAADAGGLSAFLAQQEGLQLVFLNGCSTQQQTQGLLNANVPAVISTSRAIDDQVATDFSCQFYQGLAGGATIRTAWNEAEATVRTAKGGNTRALYFGDAADSSGRLDADRWPWNLYLREGSERAVQWNLPGAVGDPLFGLPSLPEQELPESPYRHLNWFTRKDAEVFFGRGHQIRELYDRLTARRTAPIILFYGQSGVGKSSILDAGLIPRLEQAHEVRYLRRNQQQGLTDTLQLAFFPEAVDVAIETAWRVKEEQTGNPLIVFLDQVEELFTRPHANMSPADELEQLLQMMKATFVESDNRPRGKLVLGFRKEWLAELEARLIDYELPRTRVFLEPLDRRGVIEVVRGPARSERLRERYGLQVEGGLPAIIADDLLEDRDSAIAPTLQILLTKMWTQATQENYDNAQFSQDLYQHLKRDGILLRDFLIQQITTFRERYPDAVDSGLLLDIVALHTTPLGTADECTVAQLQRQYAHLGTTLPDLLQHCQDLYLLTVAAGAQKESTRTTRLAHDTLAPLVRERFDESDKPGQRARRILDNRSVDWSRDQTGTPLDEADLKVVEQGVAATRALSATEQRLVEASRDLRVRLKRLRMILTTAGAVAVAIVAVTACVALWQWSEADAAKGKALTQLAETNHNLGLALLERATKYHEEGKYTHAYLTAGRAVGFDGCGGPLTPYPPRLKAGGEGEAFLRASTIARHSASRGQWPERIIFQTSKRDSIFALAIDSTGQRLAVENETGDMHILDMQNGGTVLRLRGPKEAITDIQFSNTGNLATSHVNGKVLLWNLSSQQYDVINDASGHTFRIAFSYDGKLLAAAGDSEDATLLWDIAANKRKNFDFDIEPEDPVLSVAFDPNTRHLVTGTRNGLIKIYDLDGGKLVGKVKAHSDRVWSLAFGADGDLFASGSGDKKVKFWSVAQVLAASSPEPLRTVTAHRDQVSRVAFSGDGKIFASSSWDGTVCLFDASTMQPVATLDAHDARVDGLALVPGDSTHLVTADLKGNVREWRASLDRSGPPYLDGHSRTVGSLAVHPKRDFIASGGWDGKVLLWERTAGKSRLLYEDSNFITALVFSSSGQRLYAAGKTGRIAAIDISDGNKFMIEDKLAASIKGLALSPDEQVLASAGDDGEIGLWSAISGQSITTPLDEHDANATAVCFNPSGTRLVSSGSDGCICVWDATDDYKQLWKLQVHKKDGMVHSVMSRDGTHIYSAGWDGKVCRTAIDTGETVTVLDAGVALMSLALTADSNRLAVACNDRTVRIWDLKSMQQIAIMPDRNPYLYTLALSKDERWLAYPGENGTIKFLDMQVPSVPKLDESRFHFKGLDVGFGPPE